MSWQHNLNPIILDFGAIQVRWYGLMYVIGFLIGGYLLGKLTEQKFFKTTKENVDSLVTTVIILMFIFARLAYVFIYNWDYYSDHLEELLSVWKGGLSFHGAIVGFVIGGLLFARKHNLSWFQVMDSIALAGTQGLFFGRLGNFINGELYGRMTDSWVGIIFPQGGPYPRHPSQLYEAVAEGIILSLLLWMIKSRTKIYGIISAFFMIGYGSFRFMVEFFREPDAQLGFIVGSFSMGQILCFIMILIGIILLKIANDKKLVIS